MNKGTAQGTIEEISLVKELNKDKQSILWEILEFTDNSNLYAVRCSTQKLSKISESIVSPKTDVFIIKTNDMVELDDYFLDENMIENQKISFEYILNSGISVKEKSSTSFTYQKMTRETFFKVFGNYELGCAIEYYTLEKDKDKNDILEKAWNTNKVKILEVIKDLKSQYNYDKELKLSNDKEIKRTAIALTKHIIDNKKEISDFIFRGVGAFENPFFVDFLYKEEELLKNCYPSKYSITTGSGRSKGDYTVVIKP